MDLARLSPAVPPLVPAGLDPDFAVLAGPADLDSAGLDPNFALDSGAAGLAAAVSVVRPASEALSPSSLWRPNLSR